MIDYTEDRIRIRLGTNLGEAPIINTLHVQNRLTNEDFKQFWGRMKQEIRTQLIGTKILLPLMICAIAMLLILLVAGAFKNNNNKDTLHCSCLFLFSYWDFYYC